MSQRFFKDHERNLEFKEGGFAKTIKGAQFWGRIIAIEEGDNPGCTLMAIASGFQGVKHVYPFKQLEPLTDLAVVMGISDVEAPFTTMGVGNGSGREFIHGPYSSIKRAQRFIDIAQAAITFVNFEWGQARGQHPDSREFTQLVNVVINRDVGL